MKLFSTYLLIAGLSLSAISCSDFLDTVPKDALSPETTWKTEADAQSFVVGCYNKLFDPEALLYLDCGSDIGYNNFPWEGWRAWGDGSLSSGNTGYSFYSYTLIRRCNTVLDNIDKVEFSDEATKKDLIAQVRAMRAYSYFLMNWWYGGVPIIDSYLSAQEAQVPRKTEEEVRAYIADDIKYAEENIKDTPSARGRIAKGAVLALKMREALYYGDWQKAKDAAQAVINLKQYELDPDYTALFKVSGQNSKEIIIADQRVENTFGLYEVIGRMCNNKDGGWSSIVPTENLLDMYEMKNGLTKDETGSGYDATHPFANRDPRMAMTILYPGQEWKGEILNTLDEEGGKNINYPTYTDNASKTALTWSKYLTPLEQYSNIWNSSACVIVFRYAEVLLSYAEADNELNGPTAQAYDYIDAIRQRVDMPKVDRTKYNTKEKFRDLIHRERCIELAGEGLRRADIVRWKDSSGKMVAETVMNGTLERITGTVNKAETDPTKRATVTGKAEIETRKFSSNNRYLPFSVTDMTNNPKLEQNKGY